MGNIDDLVTLLRIRRHDFMNDLQIIYGYLQIDKIKEAKDYIRNMSKRNEILSVFYNLGDNYLALCFENSLMDLWKRDVEVVLDVEIDHLDKSIFEVDYDKKINLVNNIFNDIENIKSKFVYIYLYEDEKGKNLFIGNSEELVEELNWLDEWDEVDINMENVKLHKCVYEDNVAYKILCLSQC
ncbi:Spo0B domain-containing protein [Haloimpatiens sp. FM7315]|uniref:Spo0B domain-containing protein n=1 Tax=Haloimpatiens sp. FM7315 TaxID=3298609 RepID=UPI0035A3C304